MVYKMGVGVEEKHTHTHTHTLNIIYYKCVNNVKTNYEENYGIRHFKNMITE